MTIEEQLSAQAETIEDLSRAVSSIDSVATRLINDLSAQLTIAQELQAQNKDLTLRLETLEANKEAHYTINRGLQFRITELQEGFERTKAADLTYHHSLEEQMSSHIHEERTIRRRIHASTSVKGVKKLEHTLEGQGYSREEMLAEWDAQDHEIEARQPAGGE